MSVLLLLLVACSQTAGRPSIPATAAIPASTDAGCCRNIEKYPRWAVALAEPVAPFFGRLIAHIHWRNGYLSGQGAAIATLERQLRPLDIVVVGNRGRLSGYTIPGWFHHGAVYLGTSRDIRRLGAWNDPAIRPHRAALADGETMIESDSKNVHLSQPIDVLGADQVVVLRPHLPCNEARRKTLRGLFGHLGTEFDYVFDSGEQEKLYCVELINHVFANLGLPERDIYRRKMIIPDDLVMQAAKGRLPLSLVVYVKGGKASWQVADRKTLIADIERAWQR